MSSIQKSAQPSLAAHSVVNKAIAKEQQKEKEQKDDQLRPTGAQVAESSNLKLPRRSRHGTSKLSCHSVARTNSECVGYKGVKPTKIYRHGSKDGVFSVQYAPDDSGIVVGYGSSGVEIVNPWTAKLQKTLHPHKYGATMAMSARYHPIQPQHVLATLGNARVVLYNTENMSSVEVISGYNEKDQRDKVEDTDKDVEIYCMDYSCDGSMFAIGGSSLNITLYNATTFRKLEVLGGFDTDEGLSERVGHTRRIFTLRFHPTTADVFMSGGWDGSIKVWDLRVSEGRVRNIMGPFICGDSIDCKGNTILAGSWRKSNAVQMYDLGMGKVIDTYPMNLKPESGGEYVYTARIVNNSTIVVGGSGTNSVQAINTISKQVIGEIDVGCTAGCLDTNGKDIAIGASNDVMRFAEMTTEKCPTVSLLKK